MSFEHRALPLLAALALGACSGAAERTVTLVAPPCEASGPTVTIAYVSGFPSTAVDGSLFVDTGRFEGRIEHEPNGTGTGGGASGVLCLAPEDTAEVGRAVRERDPSALEVDGADPYLVHRADGPDVRAELALALGTWLAHTLSRAADRPARCDPGVRCSVALVDDYAASPHYQETRASVLIMRNGLLACGVGVARVSYLDPARAAELVDALATVSAGGSPPPEPYSRSRLVTDSDGITDVARGPAADAAFELLRRVRGLPAECVSGAFP